MASPVGTRGCARFYFLPLHLILSSFLPPRPAPVPPRRRRRRRPRPRRRGRRRRRRRRIFLRFCGGRWAAGGAVSDDATRR